jgi:HPt (histidine-containing phosphotransfer) domain-containing protein
MNKHSFQQSGGSDGAAAPISEAEYQALVEMVGPDSPEVMVDLIDTYLDESLGLVRTIQEGASSGNLNSMLRPAHSLKSSSASIGAMRLSKYCADLEAHLRGSLPNLDVGGQVLLIDNEFGRVQASLNEKKTALSG